MLLGLIVDTTLSTLTTDIAVSADWSFVEKRMRAVNVVSFFGWKQTAMKMSSIFPGHTVDGQNPAPPRMMIIPLFIGF